MNFTKGCLYSLRFIVPFWLFVWLVIALSTMGMTDGCRPSLPLGDGEWRDCEYIHAPEELERRCASCHGEIDEPQGTQIRIDSRDRLPVALYAEVDGMCLIGTGEVVNCGILWLPREVPPCVWYIVAMR